jgi:hypothetical protein
MAQGHGGRAPVDQREQDMRRRQPVGQSPFDQPKEGFQGKERRECSHHQAQGLAHCQGLHAEVGVDFEEVFAPIARMESAHTILAVVAHEGWRVHHMDVKLTFLNGELEEEV